MAALLRKKKKVKVPFTVVVRNIIRGNPATFGGSESSSLGAAPELATVAAAPVKKKKKKVAQGMGTYLILGGVVVAGIIVIAMLRKPRGPAAYLADVRNAGKDFLNKVKG